MPNLPKKVSSIIIPRMVEPERFGRTRYGNGFCGFRYLRPDGGGTGACVSVTPEFPCPLRIGEDNSGGPQVFNEKKFTEDELRQLFGDLVKRHRVNIWTQMVNGDKYLYIQCLTNTELTDAFKVAHPHPEYQVLECNTGGMVVFVRGLI